MSGSPEETLELVDYYLAHMDKTMANHGICLRSLDKGVKVATVQTLASRRWPGSKEYRPYLAIIYFSETGNCES
ncbi:MAG TPA: hypothetical protein DEA73_00080 [Peptococcaceae bacterium]|nr:MAG: hypothetical protein XD51_0096 [Moorella sp. 60_41]HBT46269.1 hypothetical protein [Peptococcaceae bacterium]